MRRGGGIVRFDDEDPVTACTGECVRETPSALLVRDEDGAEEWWPRSQIHADSDIQGEGDEGDLVVTAWLARERGLA